MTVCSFANNGFMKTIFFLLPNLDAGGAERVSITIARILKNKGFQVEFLNLGAPIGEMLSWITPEFKLTSLGYKRVLTSLPRLIRHMRSHSSDWYFASREHTNIVGLIAAKVAGNDIIVRLPNMPKNNLDGGSINFKSRVLRCLNNQYLKTARTVIAQNEEMRLQLIEVYPSIKEKVVAINNPIDKEYVIKQTEGHSNPFYSNEINFLAACTVDYRKGIDVLIQAWPKVINTIPKAHLYIIGRDNSDYAFGVKKQAERYSNITFLGFQSNPYPYMKYCDVFVLSSRMEGFPNVVLEAMCFNKPVASTTCVDVINEIIKSGVNGYTCGIEDSEALADAMINASQLQEMKNSYDLFQIEQLLEVFR